MKGAPERGIDPEAGALYGSRLRGHQAIAVRVGEAVVGVTTRVEHDEQRDEGAEAPDPQPQARSVDI